MTGGVGRNSRGSVRVESASWLDEHGQPHGWLSGGGPFYTVFAMGGDAEVISGSQRDRVLIAVEPHDGFTTEYNHPFTFILVVPESIRATVAGGDNPFDAGMLMLGEYGNQFTWQLSGEVGEEVLHGTRCEIGGFGAWSPASR